MLYFAASLVSQASALVRYIVLARLLGPEQLGVAATLVVTASFFDLISDTGSDRFLIQDRNGDDPEVQGLVHFVYACRGAAVALALVVFASPIAVFYKTPALAGGLAGLALSPLILGLQHLDYRRVQRHQDFRPEAICMIFAEVVGLAATTLAAVLTHSFHAVLIGLVTRALALVCMSHMRAQRPYRMAWRGDLARPLSRFALPLMLNGLMLFVVSQGDRVIVGRELGLDTLGRYSATMLLVFYPSVLFGRYIHALYIPMIAAERDDVIARNRVVEQLGGLTIILTAGLMIGFAAVGPSVIPLLFGSRFRQDAQTVALVGILQSARFLLNWPSTASLASGRSGTVLASNVAHFAAFACAVAGARLLGGLRGMLVGFTLGELGCAALAIVLLNRDAKRFPLEGGLRLVEFAGLAAIILLYAHASMAGGLAGWVAFALLAPLSLAAFGWLERRALREAASLMRRVIGKGSRLG